MINENKNKISNKINNEEINSEKSSITEFNASENENENEIRPAFENFKSRLPLIILTLNPNHEEFYPNEDPLESGLLFAVLLRKFSQMLENPRIDNLILTEIWCEIASLPLDLCRPETFYLYSFCLQSISKSDNIPNIGLFSAIESIQSQISRTQSYEYLDDLVFYRKIQLGLIKPTAIPPMSERSEDQIFHCIKKRANLIDGVIVFEEFMKEYFVYGNQQKQIIKMMHEYSRQWQSDQKLEELIKKRKN